MYAAKRAGRNCQVWFDQKMERELLLRTQLEDEIRNGVELPSSFRSISPRSTSEPVS